MYARVTWSFQVLGAGCWPLHGYDKEEFAKHTFRARYKGCCLAGGIHGLLDAVLADLEYHAMTFEIDNYGCNDMCHLCVKQVHGCVKQCVILRQTRLS